MLTNSGNKVAPSQQDVENTNPSKDNLNSALVPPVENASTKISDNANIQREKNESETQEKEKEAPKKCNLKAWAPRLVIIAVILTILIYSIINSSQVSDWLASFIEWIEKNPVEGVFILIFAYIFATVAFIPGSILTVGAGFVFYQVFDNVGLAVLVGTIAVWTGAEVGSILAMLLGRYVFREALKEKAKKWKYFNAIDKAVISDGFKLVFFLRLTPVMPFNLFNYLMGLTGVKTKHYALGGLGMLPGTIMFVYVGTTLSNIADLAAGNYSGGTAYIILLVVGTILGFGVLIYIGKITKKELNKYIETEKKEQEDKKENQEGEPKEGEQQQQNIEVELQQKDQQQQQQQQLQVESVL